MGILAAGFHGGAHAQDASEVIEEVTVTGSRLRRDGMSTPTPLTTIDSEEIRDMAPTLLMDALDQMPQFRQNDLSYTGSIFATAGQNSVNLRGIGTNRTLVLLDGRRVVGSSQQGVLDIALLPESLIDRVEVVTGGASAAYGSDAVSGVTNFILNTDFVGTEVNLSGGMTDLRDHDNYEISLTGGMELGERGHIIGAVDYYQADGVQGYRDRDWFQGWTLFTDLTATPARFVDKPGCSRNTSLGGVVPRGPLAGTQFIDGVPSQLPDVPIIVGNQQVGGDCVDFTELYGEIRPNNKRHSAFIHATYEFSDRMEGYFQVLDGHHEVETMPAPLGFASIWPMELFVDNPYLPETFRQRMIDEGLESVPFHRVFADLGPTRGPSNDTTSITVGMDAQIGDDTFISGYYQFGENDQDFDYSSNNGNVRTDRFYRALDSAIDPATGQIVCRSSIPGIGVTPEEEEQTTKINNFGRVVHGDPLSNRNCVPLDPFANPIDPTMKEYITSGIHHFQTVEQDVLELTLSTQFGESGARPISFGGGLAYREETLHQDAFGSADDPRYLPQFGVFGPEVGIRGVGRFVQNRGVFVVGNPNAEGPIVGDFDVWEVFTESIVPIFRVDSGTSADLHLAVRYADYAGSGGVWAGKVGGDWQINDQLRFRGTLSRDTRAGSLSERFDTRTGGSTVDDPLNPELGPYAVATTTGGNPNINPEQADTTTLGIVYQPAWALGLSFSVDYYDISIHDAIDQLGSQEIIDRCHASNGAAELCSLITRNIDTGGTTTEIREVFDLFINIAETVTTGVDLELSYERQINFLGTGNESIRVRGFANYLDEVASNIVGVPVLNLAGEINFPEWLINTSVTYANGPFRLNWQTRYRDSTVRDVEWVSGVDIDDNNVPSAAYTNVNMSYDFEFGDDNAGEVFFYIGNLFDKDPPPVPGTISGTTGGTSHTNAGAFDELGRTYNAGIRLEF